ncbi:terpene synthase family protein [Streptacidiphilus cavernicola]|uniref:Terpene synthase n=1 Tax=Streptacidiphilus cavernicola TaxID=3342716 RepID=A0ABV6W4B6_9ACTN
MGTGLFLPPFYCPIESAIHPAAERIEREAVAWLDATGIFTDAADRAWNIATHAAEFSCRLAPEGDEERLLLFAMWNHWMFGLDDARLDNSSRPVRAAETVDLSLRMIRCIEAPGSTMLGANPVADALADLVVRTRALTTPVQFQRLAEGARDFLLGVAWQNANIERGVVPPLADFVPGRIADVGGRFDAAFIEIANDIEVPAEQLYADPVRAVTEAAGFIVGCDNDLLSYAKEDRGGGAGQNILDVLMHHHRCSFAAALEQATAVRDRAMTLFLRLREQVAREAGPDLRRYLEGLGHFIAGNIQWSDTAPRYASPRNRHLLPDPLARLNVSLRDTPSDPRTEPLPIPTVAWWWTQLRTTASATAGSAAW